MQKKWIAALVVLALLVVGGIGFAWRKLSEPKPPVSETVTDTSHDQVVRSIEKQEKVVLLSLGIQGITEQTAKKQVWGVDVPGSNRTVFMQYSYDALLGIDGKDVTIKKTGEKAYQVTIPEFLFIGHDDVEFKTAVEKNGVLSWVTPEIDQPKLINEVLNAKAKQGHVEDNRDQLQRQAKNFYGGIIRGVDPDLRVDYRFTASK